MHYLYIDESGDIGDYQEKTIDIVGGSSRFLTLGGIIVNDVTKLKFKEVYDNIVLKFFNGSLPPNFKIHYEELRNAHKRNGKSIYSSWNDELRLSLANHFFNAIKFIDCKLLSVSIDLKRHCTKYGEPFNPTAYALYIILERFQYFLEEINDYGEVIYERFGDRLRKKVGIVHKQISSTRAFPKYTSFQNINKRICNGNPCTEYMLQFSDFFAYAPWIKCDSCCKKTRRYDEIKHKYYNYNTWDGRIRGNYEL